MQAELTTEERNWAMAAHLSALIAVVGLPFGHIVGPLVVYLVKGAQSPFVGRHARASLNYQITVSLAAIVLVIVAAALMIVFALFAGGTSSHSEMTGTQTAAALGVAIVWIAIIGIVCVAVVLSVVFIIIGTIAASEGRPYRYPFAVTFIRDPQ